MQQLAKRRPHSRSRGRPSTPGEVALRMLVLKRLTGWSFEQTEYGVHQNLVYRHLARVYFEQVPDAKTLVRRSAAIGEEGIKTIHQRVVEMAREQRLMEGRRARVDTTVVESNIRYPTRREQLSGSQQRPA
jgi:IS5 family transposase